MESVEITSILDSVKKKLGLDPTETTEFDADLIDGINTAFSTLTELGVGPEFGFEIHGNSETWTDFIAEDKRLNMVKSYVFVQTKLLFDPPKSSYLVTALQEKAKEYEWRLNVFVETPEAFPSM